MVLSNLFKERCVKFVKDLLLGNYEIDKDALYRFIIKKLEIKGATEELKWYGKRSVEHIINTLVDFDRIYGEFFPTSTPRNIPIIDRMISRYLDMYDAVFVVLIGDIRGDKQFDIKLFEYMLLTQNFSIDDLNLILESEKKFPNGILSIREILELNTTLSEEARVFMRLV